MRGGRSYEHTRDDQLAELQKLIQQLREENRRLESLYKRERHLRLKMVREGRGE